MRAFLAAKILATIDDADLREVKEYTAKDLKEQVVEKDAQLTGSGLQGLYGKIIRCMGLGYIRMTNIS